MIRRREFIMLLGGPVAWPMAARGQQRERMRRIGVLIGSRSVGADGIDGKTMRKGRDRNQRSVGWGWS